MPIQIIPLSKSFTDVFGNSTNDYRANAGDIGYLTFEIKENIYHRSTNEKPLRCMNGFSTSNTRIFFPDYESMNGFSVNQNVELVQTAGITVTTVTTTITNIDYSNLMMEFDDVSPLTPPSGQFWSDTTVLEIYSTDLRTNLIMHHNYVLGSLIGFEARVASTSPGAYVTAVNSYRPSLIDGNRTPMSFDTSTLSVGDPANTLTLYTNSGSFPLQCTIERLADINDYTRRWKFVLTTTQPGSLVPQGFLNATSFSLSYYFDFEWYSSDDLDNPTVVQWNYNNLQTGRFDRAYFSETPQSYLIQAVTGNIIYSEESTHQVKIQGGPNIAIGAMYLPEDDTYFKLKYSFQSSLCMVVSMFHLDGFTGVISSATSPNDGGYEIEIMSLDYTDNVHTIDFKFRPSSTGSIGENFIEFMDGRNPDDRRFLIYFKVDNVNHLVFDKDFDAPPKPVADISVYQGDLDEGYPRITTDKQDDFYDAVDGASASKEDNMLLITGGSFPKSITYEGLYMRLIVAEIANPDNKFTLEETYFNFFQQDVSSDGTLNANMTKSISENIQSTSGLLRALRVSRQGVFLPPDTFNSFSLAFYFPFVINWRYWQEQLNAFAEFYPNQNKDYINYINDDFGIFAEVYLVGDTLDIRGVYPINVIYDYGEEFTTATEEWQGSITPAYFINSNDQPVSTLINGQVIRMEWTVNTGIEALANSYWGNITIEPKENMPRWMISSNYAHDNNVNNPFAPLPGQDRLKRELIGPNQVKYSCLIDCSKLNNNSLYKVTIKHFNQNVKNEQVREDYDIKTVDFPFVIEESIGGQTDCCEVMKVFGSSTSNESYKNQKTSAFKKIMDGNIYFELYKDGVLTEYQPEVIPFVSDPDALYATINWSDVLESDGEGCYEYIIRYVDEFENEFTQTWGKYLLMEWSIENCAGLVQIDSVFNSNQSIQNINFTNSFVADTLNIPGMFGKRDPKTQIDNNIYGNRISVKVVRENLNQYTLETDPITSFLSRKLTDLHLLSENECQITDYNSFNHDNYVNFPVIVDEVQSPEYYDYSPKAKFSALFSDKTKNQRSFY